MQKKWINIFLMLWVCTLGGCSSVFKDQYSGVNIAASDTDTGIFVDPAISRSMGEADRQKLQLLVATAQSQQSTKWVSNTTGTRFEFTSLRIYVNAQGQGCRNYKITKSRYFFEDNTFFYTACRGSQATWRVVKSRA